MYAEVTSSSMSPDYLIQKHLDGWFREQKSAICIAPFPVVHCHVFFYSCIKASSVAAEGYLAFQKAGWMLLIPHISVLPQMLCFVNFIWKQLFHLVEIRKMVTHCQENWLHQGE